MISKRVKIIAWKFLAIALILLLINALIVTYYVGYMQGRAIELNASYRLQRECVQSILENDEEFDGLTLNKTAYIPFIVGRLNPQQLAALRDRLSRKYGDSWAELVTQDISVK